MTGLHSRIRCLQDFEILPDLLGFEILVGYCLELKDIGLEILQSCLIHKCFKGSINCVNSVLYLNKSHLYLHVRYKYLIIKLSNNAKDLFDQLSHV